MPTQINATLRGFDGTILSNLTARHVRRCCRRRVCRRQAALFFYYESEMCPCEHGTVRSTGALHASDISMACTLTVPLHPVSRCRPPAVWQLRSWLEAEGELYSTTLSAPTVAGPIGWLATTVQMSKDARDARKDSLYCAACMPPCMAPCRTVWPGLTSLWYLMRMGML